MICIALEIGEIIATKYRGGKIHPFCYWRFSGGILSSLKLRVPRVHVFIRIWICFHFVLANYLPCPSCWTPSPRFPVSPTNLSQFNLPGPSMMRSSSIPAQDSSFDLYDDAQLCGSATSLEERPRAISHSGSFRDSMEEGNEDGNGGR